MIFQNGISRYGHKPLTFHGTRESRVEELEPISRRLPIIGWRDDRCFANLLQLPGTVFFLLQQL